MAEVNNCPEPTFPTKRISDLTPQDSSLTEPKKPKLDSPEIDNSHTNNNNGNQTLENKDEEKAKQQQEVKEEEQEKEEQKEEEEEEEGVINGKAEIDRKGKGILIEEDDDDEDDDDDDDDDSDSDSDSDSETPICDGLSEDSDFVDDPLAEVDLDNILPSRTRRKTIDPSSYRANDLPPEDDDDSDDPDA